MADAKHTHGAWTAEFFKPLFKIVDATGNEFARVFGGRELGQGTIEANARLICAAPDLLAILAPFIEIWDRGGEDYEKRMEDYWGYDNLSKARAAIAKATGEK